MGDEQAGLWLGLLVCAVLALAGAAGFWFDRHHPPRRNRLLTTPHERAEIMARYYVQVRGTEW